MEMSLPIYICMQLPIYICIYIDTYTHILIRRILNIYVYRRWSQKCRHCSSPESNGTSMESKRTDWIRFNYIKLDWIRWHEKCRHCSSPEWNVVVNKITKRPSSPARRWGIPFWHVSVSEDEYAINKKKNKNVQPNLDWRACVLILSETTDCSWCVFPERKIIIS